MKSIFVSSTFKDMQFERDFMQSDIIPELNKFAMEFGQQLRFVDLRWGVNTSDLESDEGANKVLSVCLDEIDNCSPYMIVILGERYGWVPDSKHLLNCAKSKNYEIDDVIKSVTALEIEYGALSEKSKPENCLFFIRDNSFMQNMPQNEREFYESENEDSQNKLNVLKEHLIKNFENQVFHYSPKWDNEAGRLILPDSFKANMVAGIKNLMQEDFERISGLNDIERDEIIANLYIEEKQAQFSTRFDIAQNIADKIKNDKELVFIINGQEGSGRSCLAAQIAKHLKQDNISANVFVAQTGKQTGDAFAILKHFIYNLQKLLKLETQVPEKYEQAKELFEYLLCTYGEKNMPLHVFTIINAENIYDKKELYKFSIFPPNLPSNVKFVLTFHSEIYYRAPLNLREFIHETVLSVLNDVQKTEMINGILKAHGKELDEKVVASIVRKTGAKLPLYINLIVQRLLIFDIDDFERIKALGNDMDAISTYMCLVVDKASDDIESLAFDVLIEIAQKINYDTSMQIFLIISASTRELRQTDFESVLNKLGFEYSAMDMSRLFLYLSKMLKTGPNGEISFAYEIFSKKLFNIFEEEDLLMPVCQVIFEHLKQLDINDVVRKSDILGYAYVVQDYDFMHDYFKMLCDDGNAEMIDIAAKQFENLHIHLGEYEELSQGLLQAAQAQNTLNYILYLYSKIIYSLNCFVSVKNNEFIIYITNFLLNYLRSLGYLNFSDENSIFFSIKAEIADLYGDLFQAQTWSANLTPEKAQEIYDEQLVEMCASGIDSDDYDEQMSACFFIERVICFASVHSCTDIVEKYADKFIDFSKKEFERTKEPTFAMFALNAMCEIIRIYVAVPFLLEDDDKVKDLESVLEFSESLKENGEIPPEYEGYFVKIYQSAVSIYEKVVGKDKNTVIEYADKAIELSLKLNSEQNDEASIDVLADMYYSKGVIYYHQEQVELAIKALLKSQEYYEESISLNLTHQAHYYLAQTCYQLINCYEKLENYKQVMHYCELEFEHILKYYELGGYNFWYLTEINSTIGKAFDIFYSKEDYEKAIVWLERYTEYLRKYADEYEIYLIEEGYANLCHIPPMLLDKLEVICKNTQYEKASDTKKALQNSIEILEQKNVKG